MNELGERFGKEKVFFIKCNVLNKEDIVSLYEVWLFLLWSQDKRSRDKRQSGHLT